jgi:hypothetical protein
MGLPVAWLAANSSRCCAATARQAKRSSWSAVSTRAQHHALVSLAFRSDRLHALWRLVRR